MTDWPVSSRQLVAYLEAQGWAIVPHHDSSFTSVVLKEPENEDGAEVSIVLPATDSTIDSSRRLEQALRTLAALEDTTSDEILSRISEHAATRKRPEGQSTRGAINTFRPSQWWRLQPMQSKIVLGNFVVAMIAIVAGLFWVHEAGKRLDSRESLITGKIDGLSGEISLSIEQTRERMAVVANDIRALKEAQQAQAAASADLEKAVAIISNRQAAIEETGGAISKRLADVSKLLAQMELDAIDGGQLELGPLQFGFAEAPPLLRERNPQLPVDDDFIGKVGGVSFAVTAKSADGSKLLGLEFDARVRYPTLYASMALATGEEVRAEVAAPAWQWIPIARFAASDHNACFTLYGELLGAGPAIPDYVLNYHPAFENTLLGLRLFQADILLLGPIDATAELPSRNGAYLLGEGESPPDVEKNRERLLKVWDALAMGPHWQTYVIGDIGQSVEFRVDKDRKVVLSGTPWWSFFELAGDGSFQAQPNLSRRVSESIREHDGINPSVYESLRNTMLLSAFFRQLDDKALRKFVDTLPELRDQPRTPTTYSFKLP